MVTQKAEDKLLDAEKLLRSLAEVSLDAIYVKDLESRWLFANPALERLTGKPISELLGKTDAQIYSNPEIGQIILEHDKQVLTSGKPETFEEFIDLADGRHYFISVKSPRFDENGNIAGLVGISHDITNRKKREELLRQSEEQARQSAEELQKVMDIIPAAVWVSRDPECAEIRGNQVANRFYEAGVGENVSAGCVSGGAQDSTRRFFKDGKELLPEELPMQEAAAKKIEIKDSELEVVLPSGRKITILGSAKPLLDGEGKVRGSLASFVDITERKKAEETLRKSETKFRMAADFTFDWEYWIAPDGRLVYVSPSCERITGYKSREFKENPDLLSIIVHPEDQTAFKSHSDLASENKGLQIDFRIIDRNYEVRWISHVCQPVFDNEGNCLGRRVSNREISKRKKAEDALRISEDKFAKAFKNSPIPVTLTRLADGKVIEVNDSAVELFGFTREEAIGKTVLELGIWVNPAERTEFVKNLKETGFVRNQEFVLQRKDSRRIRSIVSVSSVDLANEKCLLTSVVDITERKKAEEALKKSEDRFRSVLDNSLDVIYRFNLKTGNYEYMSPSIRSMGFEPEEMTSMTNAEVLSRVHPNDLPALQKELAHLAETGRGFSEYRFLGKDGIYRWWSNQMIVTRDENGTPLYRDGYVRDVTERKEAEAKLKEYTKNLEALVKERTQKIESSALYARNLIEASIDPLVTISAEGKITDVNKATETVTGFAREELIGSDFSSYFTEPEKAAAGYKQVFTKGLVTDYPLAIKHKSGRITEVLYNAVVYLNEAGDIQGVFAAARDITERKELERQLQDSERLAAIGATAGMVGHDIRNPLQAITSDVYLLRSELKSFRKSAAKTYMEESLNGIDQNVQYVNKIVQDLQDYAKQLKPSVQKVSLDDLCENVLFKNGLPENINASCQVEKEAREIVTDPELLKRVLSNLVNNAVQAMPNGGNIVLHAFCDGEETVITIQDTGNGIPEEVKPKLFTPLFTTKSKGQGFGLAVVKRITESLGGTVTFESEVNRGTKFVIRLPPPRS
jgi:PAS domain S-box-containing protein